MYRATITKCAHCGFGFDIHLFGLSSRIGPPVGRCPRCAGGVTTGRREWPGLGPAARARYVAIGAFYATVFGWLCGWFARNIGALRAGAPRPGHPFDVSDPAFRVFAGAGAALVVALQIARVVSSTRRAAREPTPVRLPYFYEPSLDFGLQIKLMMLPVLAYVVADCVW